VRRGRASPCTINAMPGASSLPVTHGMRPILDRLARGRQRGRRLVAAAGERGGPERGDRAERGECGEARYSHVPCTISENTRPAVW